MDVRATVLSVEMGVQVAKKDGGTYPGSRLAYRDDSGVVKEQAFHENAFKFNSTLKAELSNCKPNDTIVIVKEKKGEFWNVMSIRKEGAVSSIPNNNTPASDTGGTAKSYASPKSTYETSDERALRQVLIVRQSALNYAIATLSVGAKSLTKEAVMTLADQYVAYVMQTKFDDGTMDNMDDDSGDVIQ